MKSIRLRHLGTVELANFPQGRFENYSVRITEGLGAIEVAVFSGQASLY